MKRNSQIELLRIISMIMIVISHYTVHCNVDVVTLPLGINRFIMEASKLGNLGVILFVLITGYFTINQKQSFKLKKLVSLVFQTFIYYLYDI